MAKLVLPAFVLFEKQPKPPNRHRVIASCTMKNRYGVERTVKLIENWPGNRWFVTASSDGFKDANTISTSKPEKAAEWKRAIKSCNVAVADDE